MKNLISNFDYILFIIVAIFAKGIISNINQKLWIFFSELRALLE